MQLPNLPNHEPYHGSYGYQHQSARTLHYGPPPSNSTSVSQNLNDGDVESDQIEPMPYHPFSQSDNPKSRTNPTFHSTSKGYQYPHPESYRYDNHNSRTNHFGPYSYRPSYTTATHDNRNMLRRHLECGNFTVTPVRPQQKDTSKFSNSPESPSIMPSPSAEYHNIEPSNPNNKHNQSQRLESHYGEDYDRRKRRRHDHYPKQSSYHYNHTNHDYERSHQPYGHLNKHQDYRDPYGYHDDNLPLEIDNNYSSGETRKYSFRFEEISRLPEDLEYYPSDEKRETSSK